MSYICSFDPGNSGGLTLISHDGDAFIRPMPTAGGRIDIHQISDLLTEHQDIRHVFIEDVHAIYGSSASSTFTFGHGLGMIEGCLIAKRLPYTKVPPKLWQKEMFQGVRPIYKKSKGKKKLDCKAMALIAAKRLFPNESFLATEKSRVPHDGMVDSALICEFARRILK